MCGIASFKFYSTKLFAGDDCLGGAYRCAGAAVDAFVGVDHVDIACGNRLNGAFAGAGAASYTGIGNFVSHFRKNLLLFVFCPANIATYLIISKPV